MLNSIHLRHAGRALGLLSLSAVLLLFTGCNQMLAKHSVNNAIEDRDVAEKTHDAKSFSPQRLDETNNLINKAQNEINQQDFKTARQTSKQAADAAEQLLKETKTARANKLKEDAFKWIAIADLNQGQQEDVNRYKVIRENNEKGIQQIDKQNYDAAIETFSKVVGDVQFLLNNLSQNAKQGLSESEQMKTDLVKEGAPDNAPEYVQQLNVKIEEIRGFIEKDNNYRAALIARDQARQIKQEGIQKTKEEKSRKQLQGIENLLEEATQLGAEIYAQQNFRTVSKDFETLLTQFYDKNYDTVLTTAPKLQPRVEELILETKRVAAQAKIKEVETAINTLTDGRAREYLPGRVEQLDALVTDARKLFDETKFVESKEISLRALELNQTILGEFDNLAQQQIQGASEQLGVAEGVFTTMEGIFDQKIEGNVAAEDAALERGKNALKEELKARLNNARLALGVANLKRGEKDFRTAIETSRQVAEASDNVTQQTYRVVAHNAILELANSLSFYEGQGGRQYAAVELDKTALMLEESKVLLHDGKFRDAVRRAADTKAQQEILVQELQRVAVSEIAAAQGAVTRARGNRAEQYQSAGLNQAIVALDRARSALDERGLKSAIESANQAQLIAAEASNQSQKQWSSDLLAEAGKLLEQGTRAGTERYAGEQVQVANSRVANTRHLIADGQYQAAIDAGQQAVEAAHSALYSKVIRAESEIASAKRYQGWEYEPELLARAIVAAKEAHEQLDAGNFARSEEFANAAIVNAGKVSLGSKRKSFETRMAALSEHIEDAKTKGAGYYQVRDLSKLMSEMHRLRNEFTPEGWEDLSKRVELLEAQLGGLMEMTPDALNAAVESMRKQWQDLVDRGARTNYGEKMELIDRKIKYAQLDFKAEKFRPSYANAKDAQIALDEVAMQLNVRDYDAALNTQLERFRTALHKFGPVLNMGSTALTRLVIGPQGRPHSFALLQASSPSDLRTEITQIGAEVTQMKPPATRESVHLAVLRMLQIAQTGAANFEKLIILDQYTPDQAREITSSAYIQIYQAREEQNKIQELIAPPDADFRPVGVERVVSYSN